MFSTNAEAHEAKVITLSAAHAERYLPSMQLVALVRFVMYRSQITKSTLELKCADPASSIAANAPWPFVDPPLYHE